ncbi:MAG: cyclase family protein, partial [Terriglobia bacterium]
MNSPSQKMPSMTESGKAEITLKDIHTAAERLSNWGRWGPNDEIGTLNHISAKDILEAAQLIRKGKVFSLALDFDNQG